MDYYVQAESLTCSGRLGANPHAYLSFVNSGAQIKLLNQNIEIMIQVPKILTIQKNVNVMLTSFVFRTYSM